MAEKIGQILIRKGKITVAQLRDALRTQQFFGGYLGSHLINLGFIDEASLGETLSEIFRVPFAPYESIRLARPDAIGKLPSELAHRLRVIPLHINGNRIHLAMLNPRDAAAIREVTAVTGYAVAPWVAPEFRIVHALDRHYRIRREKRGSIAVNAPSSESEPHLEDIRPGVWTDPHAPELGLDGHPIHATVLPELGGTLSPKSSGPVPRTLDEWREADDRFPSSAPPPPSPSMNRPSTPPPTATFDPGAGELLSEDDLLSLGMPAPPRPGASMESKPPTRPHLPPPESHEKAPDRRPLPKTSIYQGFLDLDRLTDTLASVASRDELAQEVISFLADKFKRAAVFAIRGDRVAGWIASEAIPADRLARTVVPLTAPSIFGPVLESPDVHIGSISSDPSMRALYESLGIAPPPALLMIPVLLRDRIVAILYADNDRESLGPIDLSLWRRLAQVMAMALEILIIKAKMRRG